jgi:protein transport protein SEC24
MVLTRRVAATLPGGTLAACREAVTAGTVATLAAYRKHCASQSSAVQLILPGGCACCCWWCCCC